MSRLRQAVPDVIAHLSFSLHFLHHHLAGHHVADDHARAYVRILASLHHGGRFAYVPSVPPIEAVLDPAHWQVQRATVPGTRLTRTIVTRRTDGRPHHAVSDRSAPPLESP